MSDALTVTRVDELRAELTFVLGAPVTLRDLERFCEALRAAGATGALPIKVVNEFVGGTPRSNVLKAVQPKPVRPDGGARP